MKLNSRKSIYILMMLVTITVTAAMTGCTNPGQSEDAASGDSYRQITQEDAKAMMVEDNGHVIVDVRTQEEFEEVNNHTLNNLKHRHHKQ